MPTITIAGLDVTRWHGNTSNIQLRIFTNSSFHSMEGTMRLQSVLSNPASLGTFYSLYPCPVTGTTLTIPDVMLESTKDSPDNPEASYSAVLWDATVDRQIQIFGTLPFFTLDPYPITTTWADIFASEANG